MVARQIAGVVVYALNAGIVYLVIKDVDYTAIYYAGCNDFFIASITGLTLATFILSSINKTSLVSTLNYYQIKKIEIYNIFGVLSIICALITLLAWTMWAISIKINLISDYIIKFDASTCVLLFMIIFFNLIIDFFLVN